MAGTSTVSNFIYRRGTAPETRAAVSQKNKIYGYTVGVKGWQQLGVISEFAFDESRDVQAIRGVGFGDQIAELVPGVTEAMTITLNKTLLYTVNLFQVLGYKGGIDGLVRSLRHHRWPFDIKQELVISELVQNQDTPTGTRDAAMSVNPIDPHVPISSPIQALVTVYEGCWFNSYSASFTSDAAIVAENSSVTVTDIIDGTSTYGEYIDSGLAPTEPHGTAGGGYSLRFASDSNTVARL
jgi:hypothetical protein